MCEYDNIKRLTDLAIGDSKKDYANNGWYEYNCPCCADANGGVPDDKYNLAVKIDDGELWMHCWKCGYSGKLSKLFKDYGGIDLLNTYRDEIHSIRERQYYEFGSSNIQISDLLDDIELELPKEFRSFNTKYDGYNEALMYLRSRGIGDDIIKRFNIGYTGFCDNYKLRNRIIIPSYNSFDELTYWVGRDFTGTNKLKIINPEVDKSKVLFDDGLINWYEPITLVEGPFDHIVVPNSIPLLGKYLNNEMTTYKELIKKCRSTVNILLDDDAIDSAYKLYNFLNNSPLRGRVYIIECPKGYDASDIYRDFNKRGILKLLNTAHKIDEYKLSTLF